MATPTPTLDPAPVAATLSSAVVLTGSLGNASTRRSGTVGLLMRTSAVRRPALASPQHPTGTGRRSETTQPQAAGVPLRSGTVLPQATVGDLRSGLASAAFTAIALRSSTALPNLPGLSWRSGVPGDLVPPPTIIGADRRGSTAQAQAVRTPRRAGTTGELVGPPATTSAQRRSGEATANYVAAERRSAMAPVVGVGGGMRSAATTATEIPSARRAGLATASASRPQFVRPSSSDVGSYAPVDLGGENSVTFVRSSGPGAGKFTKTS